MKVNAIDFVANVATLTKMLNESTGLELYEVPLLIGNQESTGNINDVIVTDYKNVAGWCFQLIVFEKSQKVSPNGRLLGENSILSFLYVEKRKGGPVVAYSLDGINLIEVYGCAESTESLIEFMFLISKDMIETEFQLKSLPEERVVANRIRYLKLLGGDAYSTFLDDVLAYAYSVRTQNPS